MPSTPAPERRPARKLAPYPPPSLPGSQGQSPRGRAGTGGRGVTRRAAPPGSGTPPRPQAQRGSGRETAARAPARQPPARAGSGQADQATALRPQPVPGCRKATPAPRRPPLTRGAAAAAEPAPRRKDVPGLPRGRARRIRTRRRRAPPMAPRGDDSKRPISARRSGGAKERANGGCCFRGGIGAAGRGKLRIRRAYSWFEDLVEGGQDSESGRVVFHKRRFLPSGEVGERWCNWALLKHRIRPFAGYGEYHHLWVRLQLLLVVKPVL